MTALVADAAAAFKASRSEERASARRYRAATRSSDAIGEVMQHYAHAVALAARITALTQQPEQT